MRIVGFILQSIAIGIILLHSFIPHKHHSDLTEVDHTSQHVEATSFLDIVALGFHVDHQDGELEEFTASLDKDIIEYDLIQCAANSCAIHAPLFKEQKVNLYTSLEIPFLEDFYCKAIGLRGPPSLG
jgi:hypothetical protein